MKKEMKEEMRTYQHTSVTAQRCYLDETHESKDEATSIKKN